MKFIDLFAGVGGFRYGIEKAGTALQGSEWGGVRSVGDQPHSEVGGNSKPKSWGDRQLEQPQNTFECVYSNEWDKYANSVYRKHYGECDDRDIRTVPSSDIPDHDLLVGGFPCQAFSVAGKRAGFDDTRGTLFFEIARILRDKRPRYFILENVKGLLSHDSGKTFQTILGVLSNIGYGVQWQVLNSKDFGVPQNRERVFIVGHLRGTPRPEVFPLTSTNAKDIVQLNHPTHSNDRVYGDDGLAPTLNTMQGGRRQPKIMTAPNGKLIELEDRDKPYQLLETRTELGKQTRKEIRQKEGRDSTARGKNDKKYVPKNDDRANALTTGAANIEKWVIEPGYQIRRLTPIECERLQGFPDDFTKYGADGETISDTQRYKMMGNAVTTLVITEIGRKLIQTKEVNQI